MKRAGDYLTATSGDFPTDPGSLLVASTQSIPFSQNPPTGVQMYEWLLYNWFRQCGTNIDIDSATSMPSTKFNAPNPPTTMWKSIGIGGIGNINVGTVPSGINHIFEFDSTGAVTYKSIGSKPAPYLVVGQSQFYGELVASASQTKAKNGEPDDHGGNNNNNNNNGNAGAGNAQTGNSVTPGWGPFTAVIDGKGCQNGGQDHKFGSKNSWDVYFRSFVSQYGDNSGGKHAGEPLDSHRVYLPGGLYNSVAWANDYCVGGSGAGEQNGNAGQSQGGGGFGGGTPPIISQQTDFALSTLSPLPVYEGYSNGPASGAPRPTYTANGIDCEIKFRRQIDVTAL
jgi:hypothetical protein